MPKIDEELFAAARSCDTATLARLLDAHPDSLDVREPPYEWTLLHTAAGDPSTARSAALRCTSAASWLTITTRVPDSVNAPGA